MKMTSKIALLAMATAAVTASNNEGYQSISLNLPTGEKNLAGYHYDFTAETVYGTATPVTFTDKYAAAWIGDYSVSVSRTDKHLTDDPSEAWTVWTFEILKGEDDAWFAIEFGK